MATSLSLENDSSLAQGYIKVNGSTAATLTTSGITGNLTGNVTGNLTGNVIGNLTGSLTQGGSLTFATAQAASGTAVNFTGIPSWAKRITVMIDGVSTNGTSPAQIQIGDSGGFETTGYDIVNGSISGTNLCSLTQYTTGIVVPGLLEPHIRVSITSLIKVNNNKWIVSGTAVEAITNTISTISGYKDLSSTLDRVRITTVNGTDTFDAGQINIAYEG
jgi:hypothetical protein